MTKHHGVGVDVGALELVVAMEGRDGDIQEWKVPNTSRGHLQLVQKIRRRDSVARVCLESTGIYSLGVALALHGATDVEVMVVNPRAVKHYAQAAMTRAKTDSVDARTILDFVRRMEFVAWSPPAPRVLELRALTRRIHQLKVEHHREGNRLKQSGFACNTTVERDLEVNLGHLERRIALLEQAALKCIQSDAKLASAYQHLVSITGVAEKSAPVILAELSVLPSDMTGPQWVAHAGLDPRACDSGSSIHKPRRITKVGNRYLRHALYMPALVAIRYEPTVKGFYEHLLLAGKKPKQAIVAVMRKLLIAMHAMLANDSDFDAAKFYNGPTFLSKQT